MVCYASVASSTMLPCHSGRIRCIRHPIIIPHRSPLATLIVRQAHEDRGHVSADQTLQEVRKQYWILKGRLTIQRILNGCLLCKRHQAKPLQPMMADLPSFRTEPGLPAFAHTGVDSLGPIEVKMLRTRVKRYGCLLTCLTTRAVDIQMAYQLDTDSVILCLARLESRYGTPPTYRSDNGTYFVGANNEFKKCLADLDYNRLADSMTICRSSGFLILLQPPTLGVFGNDACDSPSKRSYSYTYYTERR